MDGLFFAASTTAVAASFSVNKFFLFPSVSVSRVRVKRVSFRVFAEKEEPKLDKWDQMELKFGRLLGEDPKLTIAKIMGRKANPEASYIEIEKAFYKNKGKIVEVEEVPFDVEKKSPTTSSDGLNLVRPVPKKGIKFKADDKPAESEIKRPTLSDGKAMDGAKKGRLPNVILRKPTVMNEDDVEDMPSRFRMKPKLSLKMGNEKAKEHFSDMTLLRKPEPIRVDISLDKKQDSDDTVGLEKGKEVKDSIGGFTLLKKSEQVSVNTKIGEKQEQCGDLEVEGEKLEAETNRPANATESRFEEALEGGHSSIPKKPEIEDDSLIGMPPIELSNRVSTEESDIGLSMEAALQGKPKRLDQSVKETSNSNRAETVPINPEDYGDLPSVSPQEDSDWSRVEDLLKTRRRAEVELISSSTRGFVVSFSSLIGFLPYRNLAAKWKFLAFESWLRQKGLDPSAYKQNLGVIGSSDIMSENSSLDSNSDSENNQQFEGKLSPDMKLEDLLRIYDQEKLKFLSSFVGQRVKVNVLMADRKFRKLIVSLRPKEKEELVEKKRNVMAKLRVGDVVKCCIKKITYFGIFVEVEGVPALIHQTEVSWDATLGPASYFKIGQIVEAKVHQLDFTLERIFLSLKEITLDPLIEALESVVGDHDNLDGRLQTAQADSEWPDVESLIKELEQIEGVQSVSKGRFFLSPGLAPTFQVPKVLLSFNSRLHYRSLRWFKHWHLFGLWIWNHALETFFTRYLRNWSVSFFQTPFVNYLLPIYLLVQVYMASMFENQYKLLARSGNKVQEVIVEASLDKEEMRSTILSCANRVV